MVAQTKRFDRLSISAGFAGRVTPARPEGALSTGRLRVITESSCKSILTVVGTNPVRSDYPTEFVGSDSRGKSRLSVRRNAASARRSARRRCVRARPRLTRANRHQASATWRLMPGRPLRSGGQVAAQPRPTEHPTPDLRCTSCPGAERGRTGVTTTPAASIALIARRGPSRRTGQRGACRLAAPRRCVWNLGDGTSVDLPRRGRAPVLSDRGWRSHGNS